MRQRGRHFGNTEAQPGEQERDQAQRGHHAAEPAIRQTEILAEEIARNHRTHPECPEVERSGVTPRRSPPEVTLRGWRNRKGFMRN